MLVPAVIIYLGCMVEEALQPMADGTMRRERLASNSQVLPSVACFPQTVTPTFLDPPKTGFTNWEPSIQNTCFGRRFHFQAPSEQAWRHRKKGGDTCPLSFLSSPQRQGYVMAHCWELFTVQGGLTRHQLLRCLNLGLVAFTVVSKPISVN